MKIRFAGPEDNTHNILQAVKDNDGYCPCRIEKTADNKCVCKEFRDAPAGETCHCGLYIKLEA